VPESHNNLFDEMACFAALHKAAKKAVRGNEFDRPSA